jgi:hypothetical protein
MFSEFLSDQLLAVPFWGFRTFTLLVFALLIRVFILNSLKVEFLEFSEFVHLIGGDSVFKLTIFIVNNQNLKRLKRNLHLDIRYFRLL